MLQQKKLLLSEFLEIIKWQFDEIIWYYDYMIEAEVRSIKQNRQFYYFELIEIKNWKIIDSARANIFNPRIMLSFLHETWITDVQELVWKKLLFTAKATFHKTYNFSINISKIHSDFFVWWLEKQKKQNISELMNAWIFHNNHSTNLWFPKFKIAVITSAKSEWFRDFQTILDESGFDFEIEIFNSLVHWEKASLEVLQNLEKIKEKNSTWTKYNLVAIIRWGWWSEWMNWWNDFDLSYEVCNYNIPVMSAVWHTVDKSILDMVSYFDCKTPSEAANKLIDIYYDYKKNIDREFDYINNKINIFSDKYKKDIWYLSRNIPLQFSSKIKKYQNNLKTLNISNKIIFQKNLLKNNLENTYNKILSNNPDKVIKKWYSILYDFDWKIPKEYQVGNNYKMKTYNYDYEVLIQSKQKRDL